MGIFRQFPYSNFHDMNMDQIIKIVREMWDEWEATKTEWASYKDFIDNYFNNLDVSDEVLAALRVLAADGTLADVMDPAIAQNVTEWLSEHITTPETIVIDSSLTVRGAAADARAAGKIREEVSGLYTELPFTKHDGYVDIQTGAFVPYDNWSRTDYISVDASKPLYIECDVSTNFNVMYDADHQKIKSFGLQRGTNKIVLPINAKYIALSGQNPFIDGFYAYYWHTKIYNGTAQGQFEPFHNFAYQKWYNGSLNSQGNYVESPVRLVTDFVPVSGNFEIHGEIWQWPLIIAEYDENKNNIYMQQYYYNDDFVRILKPETKYVRMVTFDGSSLEREIIPTDIYFSRIFLERKYVPADTLKVATYNVGGYHYGTGYGIPADEYDEKLIGWRRVIADLEADVLGMQEYDTRMDEANTIWSNDALWDHFYGYEATTGSQTALKSKPIMSYYTIGQLSTGRYYCSGYIAGIFILSVHLSVGANNASTRITEAQEIINMVASHDKFIIFGDFNPEVGEEDALYKKFTDAGMKLCNCGFFGKYYTWSSNREDFDDYENPTGTLWYIDNIIVSNNIDILNAYPMPAAYKMASSDHIPFIAELKVSD